MTNKNNPAFDTSSHFGLTAQEYAAIHLKVADSGTPWLDEMIEKSRRDDLAARAMQSMADRVSQMTGNSAYYGENVSATDNFSKFTFKWADAMLAASKGEK